VKQSRLLWLLGAMVVLAILRVFMPSPTTDAAPNVAEAIVRKPAAGLKAAAKVDPTDRSRPVATLRRSTIEGDDEPGNAFAVRPPPPPPYVPPVVVAKVRAAPPAPVPVVVALPVEPPPPPMPYQVIGTWDDGKEPGVFLSSPSGTVLARPGMTLQAEYKVSAITPQQITLIHLATKREVRLAVSRPPDTPRPLP
jgi:hypothetical protein